MNIISIDNSMQFDTLDFAKHARPGLLEDVAGLSLCSIKSLL